MGQPCPPAMEDVRGPTDTDMVEHLVSLLGQLSPGDDWVDCVSEQSGDAAHDAYFRVLRVRGDAAAIVVRMVFAARLCLLEDVREAGVTIGMEWVAQIDGALAALGATVLGDDAATRPVQRWETVERIRTEGWAMMRWVRGHQVFATLSQGLIFSFQAMGGAIKRGDRAGTRKWAELSIRLLKGSGAAFLFTGDFSVEEYMQLIRPTMMPPLSEICLSGLMSLDHRFLVQTMRDMRPALRALHEQEPELHSRLQEELGTVYDRHIHVCERFVGERPSLLTAHLAKKSGPSLIEQFKKLRMKSLEAPAHVQRLSEGCPLASKDDSTMELATNDSFVSSGTKNAKICPRDL